MLTYTDMTGIAGIVIALAAASLAIPGVRRLTRLPRAVLVAAFVILSLVPIGTLPLAVCLRGVTGDLSLTTLVLLAAALLRYVMGWPPANGDARVPLITFISVVALGLYPLALGLASFDPYRLGYGSWWLLGTLFAVALAAWFGRLYIIAGCIALALLAWTVRWYESTNLWDYLVDPLVSVYALGALARRGANAILHSFRTSRPGAASVGLVVTR